MANKQNVFDDAIATAEHLIEVGWTSSDRLAIFGGSNGGLLVGALLTQRPELFAAVARPQWQSVEVLYVRYESPRPNASGRHPGIFALANGLARSGQLTDTDRAWWRANNDWLDAAYPDPASVDPTLFDKSAHPVVSCWFKATAHPLLDRVAGYLDLLDRYGVAWAKRTSTNPGTILYEDDVQVVVATSG